LLALPEQEVEQWAALAQEPVAAQVVWRQEAAVEEQLQAAEVEALRLPGVSAVLRVWERARVQELAQRQAQPVRQAL